MHKADKFDRLGMIKKVTSLVEVVVIQPDKHVENKNSYKKPMIQGTNDQQTSNDISLCHMSIYH